MFLANLKVGEIVSRRDFQGTSAKLFVHPSIDDERNLAAENRQGQDLADLITVTLVFGMHSHCRVAQHSFRSGGSDGHRPLAVAARVGQMVELAISFLLLNFEVRKRGLTAWAPVNEVAAAVDQPFLIKANKHLAYRP